MVFTELFFVFVFLAVVLGSIAMNYVWGLLVDRFRDAKGIKGILAAAIGSNLLLLYVVKYLNFSRDIINSLFGDILKIPDILLPIVRYDTVAKQIAGRRETIEDFAVGIERFAGQYITLSESNAWNRNGMA